MDKTNNLKQVLKSRGVTQVWLAGELGITTDTMYRKCKQKKPLDNLFLLAISTVLNVDIKELTNEI